MPLFSYRCTKDWLLNLIEKEEKKCNGDDPNFDVYERLKGKLPTRLWFLTVIPDESIETEGNKKLQNKMTGTNGETPLDDWMIIDDPEEWRQFPENLQSQAQDRDDLDLTKGLGLELMGWLVDMFGKTVLSDRRTYETYALECDKARKDRDWGTLVDLLTLDNLAFIFLQVQNCINKWLWFHKAWKLKKGPPAWREKPFKDIQKCETTKELNKEEKKEVQKIEELGYEYKSGSGVSGEEGKQRMGAVIKFLHRAYYDPNNGKMEENKKALKREVQKLFHVHDRAAKEQPKSSNCSKNKQTRVAQGDTELKSIQDQMFASLGFKWDESLLDGLESDIVGL